MLKRIFPVLMAGAMFLSANALYAQSGCTVGKDAKCSKTCDKKCEHKTEGTKSEDIQFSTVTLDELREIMKAGTATIIDARDKASYDKGHIDGAIQIANYTYPEDKSTALIFYCGGPMCGLAPRAARKAISDGYTNTKVFTGGWLGWSEGDAQAGL